MANYSVTYGGKQGKPVRLALSDDYVVVRTRKRIPLERTRLSERSWKQIAPLKCVVCYEDAGVEVYKIQERGEKARKYRNRVRSLLKREEEIEFAGRVLCDTKSHQPVVYTENFFVKFTDDTKPSTCRRLLRKHGLKIKRALDYANNAFFAAAEEGTGLKVFSLAKKILRLPEIEFCHPELIRPAPRRVAFDEQWHLKKRPSVELLSISMHTSRRPGLSTRGMA